MFDLAQDGRIARISLNRSGARNAIRIADWADLADSAERAVAEGARTVIIRSAVTGIFSAGADLVELEALPGDTVGQRRMRTAMCGALDRLSRLPVATIAAIDGGCFGAGVALVMACDLRIGGHMAQFAIPPARLGIGYPQEDIARLVALVGPGQAARLMLTGERIGADEAHRIGLIEAVAHSAHGAVNNLAALCSESSPASVVMLKRAIAAAAAGERSGAVFDEAFERAFDGADFAEGILAMRERRAPDFGA
jgi:enoyl-CoA hydratase/carnithine racemase